MRLVAVLAIAVIAVFLTVQTALAVDPVPNPTMNLNEAHGFQHLIDEGDLLILVQYSLPKAVWRVDQADVSADTSTAPFFAYMEEGDCIDSDEENLLDLCYTSILSGAAIHTFYGGAQASSTLLRSRTAPRVGDGVSAVYFGTGHSLTFGDTTYETCIEGSATLFSPVVRECDTLLWHPISTSTANPTVMQAARATNASALVSIALNLQSRIAGRQEALVVNNFIAPTGAIFFKEGYTNIVEAAPAAFAASESFSEDITLNTVDSTAEAAITANRGLFYGYVDDFNTNHFDGNASTQLIGGFLIGAIAVFLFGMSIAYTKNMMISTIIAVTFVFGFGVLNDLFDMALYLIFLLGFFAVGIFAWVKQKA